MVCKEERIDGIDECQPSMLDYNHNISMMAVIVSDKSALITGKMNGILVRAKQEIIHGCFVNGVASFKRGSEFQMSLAWYCEFKVENC